LFAKERPQVLLINLALTDDIGHTHGANLGREQVVGVINNADRQIGRLVETYRQAGILDSTVSIAGNQQQAVLDFVTQVQQSSNDLEIQAVAAEDVYTAGAHLKLVAVQDGQVLFTTI
jgi:uncharacterized protein (DUF3084 family)